MIPLYLFSDFLSEIDEDVLPKDRTGISKTACLEKPVQFINETARRRD